MDIRFKFSTLLLVTDVLIRACLDRYIILSSVIAGSQIFGSIYGYIRTRVGFIVVGYIWIKRYRITLYAVVRACLGRHIIRN